MSWLQSWRGKGRDRDRWEGRKRLPLDRLDRSAGEVVKPQLARPSRPSDALEGCSLVALATATVLPADCDPPAPDEAAQHLLAIWCTQQQQQQRSSAHPPCRLIQFVVSQWSPDGDTETHFRSFIIILHLLQSHAPKQRQGMCVCVCCCKQVHDMTWVLVVRART